MILGGEGTLCFSRFHHSLMSHASQFHSLVYLSDPWKHLGLCPCHIELPWWLSVKNSPAMQETQGTQECPGEGNGNHSTILSWEIQWTKERSRWWSMGSQEVEFSSVHVSHSVMSDSLWPHDPQHVRPTCPSPTPGVHQNSCPLNWWCHPAIPSSVHPLLLPPSILPSNKVFSKESAVRMRWPKYWTFNFNISPSSEHAGLISFRMDWLDLLAVQGTLKSLLQHHSSKASVFQCSDFFIVQLSHPYMTTGKAIALTRRTFAGSISLCFLTCCLGWS